jgi:hypothetical protein
LFASSNSAFLRFFLGTGRYCYEWLPYEPNAEKIGYSSSTQKEEFGILVVVAEKQSEVTGVERSDVRRVTMARRILSRRRRWDQSLLELNGGRSAE